MVFIFSDCNIFCKLFPCVPWELPSAMARLYHWSNHTVQYVPYKVGGGSIHKLYL